MSHETDKQTYKPFKQKQRKKGREGKNFTYEPDKQTNSQEEKQIDIQTR